jgi:hypothetical protein
MSAKIYSQHIVSHVTLGEHMIPVSFHLALHFVILPEVLSTHFKLLQEIIQYTLFWFCVISMRSFFSCSLPLC